MLFLCLLQMLVTGRWILDNRNQKSRTIHPISSIKHPVSVLSKGANFTALKGPSLPSAVLDEA